MATNPLRRFLLLALLPVTFAIAYSASGIYPIRWSSALDVKKLADIDARLHRPFGEILEGKINGQPVTISNCADFLADSREQFVITGGNRAAIILHSNAVACIALDALKTAQPATTSYLSDFRMDASALTELSAMLAPAVSNERIAEVRQAASEGQSWQKYVPDAQATAARTPDAIDVVQPNWKTTITEYGRGDFTGDGLEDLLVRADYAAINGTYRNSSLFLLSRTNKAAILEVVKEYTIR